MTTVAAIQSAVAHYYMLLPADMKSEDRRRMIAHPRQVAMYLAREITYHSLPLIAREFHRDHTTVIHAIRAVEKRAQRSSWVRRDLNKIRKRLAA